MLTPTPERPPSSIDQGIEALRAWLDSGGRWLTLTGPPGIGKTHLLGRLTAGEALPGDVRVIDPFDGADPIEPGDGRVIAVSPRRHLHPEEQVLEVRPLSVAESAALFVEVGRGADARQHLEADDPAVRALVGQVGGHPLALILLGRRTTMMSVRSLTARLARPIADGRGPLIHAETPPWNTLRQRLDAMWSALDAPQRALLARCARFEGRFTIEDAEAVLDGPDGPDVLDGLQSLRDRSLLAQDGRSLYVLPIIRRLALARWPGERDEDTRRYRAYFADLAWGLAEDVEADRMATARQIAAREADLRHIAAGGPSSGPDAAASDAARALAAMHSVRGSASTQLEYARRAFDRCPPDDGPRRIRTHLCLAHALWSAGHLNDGRALLTTIDRDVQATSHEGRWFILSIVMARDSGDRAGAMATIDRALERTRAVGSLHNEARVLNLLALVHLDFDRYDEAIATLRAAYAILERIDAPRLTTVADNHAARAYRSTLQSARARHAARSAIASARALGDGKAEGYGRHALGRLELDVGDLAAAHDHLTAALRLHEAQGHRLGAADVLPDLAEWASESGDIVEQARLLDMAAVENHGSPVAVVANAARPPLNMPALAGAIELGRARAALDARRLETARAAVRAAEPHFTRDAAVGAFDRLDFALVALRAGRAEAARAMWQRVRSEHATPTAALRRSLELMDIALDAPAEPPIEAIVAGLSDQRASLLLRRTMRHLWPTLPRAVRREAKARLLSTGETLVLDPAQQSLRLPDGRWLHFDRWPLWMLVAGLFASAEPLDAHRLVARIWTGENISPDSAANRLYNVVAKARKAGLASIVNRTPDGYTLDPRYDRIRLAPEAIDASI